MIDEIWKNVVGYEGIYQVSNLGRIKRLGYYREIKPKGYYQRMYYKETKLS